ncbi:MAG: IS1634 family transposase [Tetragenococcus sp.]|nr:IS1634 family transposase [Tetragenococcus sp.]
MRVQVSKSKNSESLYISKAVRIDGKSTSKVVERLGTLEEVKQKAQGQDPYEWARERAQVLTEQEKNQAREVLVKFSPHKQIPANQQVSFNGGYLFLQQLYYQLGLDKICATIQSQYKTTFDLNAVLSQLIYSRILFPGSKLRAFHKKDKYLETPSLELQHFYRALGILAKENDAIQAQLYKNSRKVVDRNTRILYYDCTNFFFEIEQEDPFRKYGKSKENRPNPIVQMGLFIDGNGVPLAFDLSSGNTNEQGTLKPLEKKILQDFSLSKMVICTDAGLSSTENRKFNNVQNRAFITTQSVKKLKKHLKDWALGQTGWKIAGGSSSKEYTLKEIEALGAKEKTFFKERWIHEDGLEQRMIVSYSLKYKEYQENIRQRQVERAEKFIQSGQKLPKKKNPNDVKRFIKRTSVTQEGEKAEKDVLSLDASVIEEEARYDGFYAVCTNLNDPVEAIIQVNHQRWEIEETFRIMKSEFDARPVYLSREDRIRAHFITCFMAMMIFRLLEKRLDSPDSYCEIIETLREMNFYQITGEGVIPTYTRTDLTDRLHEQAGFRTDYQILPQKSLKKIFKQTKSGNITTF